MSARNGSGKAQDSKISLNPFIQPISTFPKAHNTILTSRNTTLRYATMDFITIPIPPTFEAAIAMAYIVDAVLVLAILVHVIRVVAPAMVITPRNRRRRRCRRIDTENCKCKITHVERL